MKKKTEMRLFAFWRYDTFPFFLGAEVLEVRDNGSVRVVGYNGMLFTPVKILPLSAGESLQANLKELEGEWREEMRETNARWRQKVTDLMGAIP